MLRISKDSANKKWIILFITVMMSFMSCIDSSIVNVALPTIAKSLSVTMQSAELVIVGYILAICATILIFGRLGDIKGKIKVFKFGMITFTLCSLACGICNSLGLLIIFRILQGIGAATYMANNQGIITQTFPKNERGKALGILATFVALGTMIGPPLGGWIVSIVSWNYIFLINIPIGIITIVLGLIILPKDKTIDEKLDIKGAILFFTFIVLLFASLIESQKVGFKNPYIILSISTSIICGILFVILEKKVNTPLMQLRIYRNKIFSQSLICAFISFICINASIIILPFYLQNTLKLTPLFSGVLMMISPLIIAIVSPFSGNLSDKIGSELPAFLGLLLMSVGFGCMSSLTQTSSIINVVVFIAIMAIGQGLFQPPNNSLIMSSVPNNELGVAGSINSLVRNLGQIVGVTLTTTILFNCMSYKIGYSVHDYIEGRDDVFLYGNRFIYITLTIICVSGAFLSLLRLYKNKTNRRDGILYE